jgi:hypothetical protein
MYSFLVLFSRRSDCLYTDTTPRCIRYIQHERLTLITSRIMLGQIVEMGFSVAWARKALATTVDGMDVRVTFREFEWRENYRLPFTVHSSNHGGIKQITPCQARGRLILIGDLFIPKTHLNPS